MATKAALKDLRNGNVFTLGEIKSQVLEKEKKYDSSDKKFCVRTEYTLGYVQEIFYDLSELGSTLDVFRSYLEYKIHENVNSIKRLENSISDVEDDKKALDKSDPRYDIDLERYDASIKHKRSLIPVIQQEIDKFTKLKSQLDIKLT